MRLSFLREAAGRSSDGRLLGWWLCSCGSIKRLPICRVRSGAVISCGCMVNAPGHGVTHGMKFTRAYSSWQAMKSRCCNPTNKDYPRWGGRGITVCESWLRFENFYADMGDRPDGTSLDRFPNRAGNYEPGNCRWATNSEQQQNKDNFTWISTPLGTMPLRDYAKHIGISSGSAHMRLKRGKLEGCSKCLA